MTFATWSSTYLSSSFRLLGKMNFQPWSCTHHLTSCLWFRFVWQVIDFFIHSFAKIEVKFVMKSNYTRKNVKELERNLPWTCKHLLNISSSFSVYQEKKVYVTVFWKFQQFLTLYHFPFKFYVTFIFICFTPINSGQIFSLVRLLRKHLGFNNPDRPTNFLNFNGNKILIMRYLKNMVPFDIQITVKFYFKITTFHEFY